MREIHPISIWYNGQIKEANNLELSIISDNLLNAGIFYYRLLNVDNENIIQLADGNINIDGADYSNWGSTGDTNAEAYQFCANKLGLILV